MKEKKKKHAACPGAGVCVQEEEEAREEKCDSQSPA